MTHVRRLRLVFHGAVVLMVGVLSGLPTVGESINGDAVRAGDTEPGALIMMGSWLLVMASVVPVLVLARREATVLFGALLAMGYGFIVALVLGGAIGVSPFEPGRTPAAFTAFVAAVIGIGGAVISAALTIMGARAALTAAPALAESLPER